MSAIACVASAASLCALGRQQFSTGLYGFWNEFYATQTCSCVKCGGGKVTNMLHRARANEVAGPGGIRVFKYSIKLPATSLTLRMPA